MWEMLGDISYHKATLQSQGKHSIHYSLYRNNRKHLSSSLSKIDAVKMRQDISPDSSLDGEFEFDHHGDSDDEDDSEIEETMEKVVKDELSDKLSDSGYGQGFEDEIEGKRTASRDRPASCIKRGRKDSTAEKLNDIAGADALLELANSAFMPSPSVPSGTSSPVPQGSAAAVS